MIIVKMQQLVNIIDWQFNSIINCYFEVDYFRVYQSGSLTLPTQSELLCSAIQEAGKERDRTFIRAETGGEAKYIVKPSTHAEQETKLDNCMAPKLNKKRS